MAEPVSHSSHHENKRNKLRWTGGSYNRRAVWPSEPDIGVIRTLAMKNLISMLPSDFDDTLFDVNFFAEGMYNKVYRVTYQPNPVCYIFRVSLPIEPFYKFESEAPTLSFLRAKTSIPVARVVAWDSNWDTELGYEWLLTEMIDGVVLCDVWRQVPWERKLMLNDEVARMIAQLHKHKFDSIGSLYFRSALESGAGESKSISVAENGTGVREETTIENRTSASDIQGKQSHGLEVDLTNLQTSLPATSNETPVALNVENADDFAVGHIFDRIFFGETRIFLPSNRGPFKNSLEWQRAAIEVQQEYINKGLSVLALRAEGEMIEYDSDLEDEAPEMKETCQIMLEILPEIFNDEEKGAQYVLHHHDLNAYNILVNPETFEIAGLLDWEMTCIIPEWEAAVEPRFLEYIVFDWEEDEDEPPIPPSWDEEGEDQFAIEKRDRWDYKLLRKHFDATLKKILAESGHPNRSDPAKTQIKQKFQRNVWNLADAWERTRRFVRKFKKEGVDPEAEVSADDDDS